MVDLHVHTTMSDGQYAPAEVVRMAAAKGIKVISVTDHDTAAGTLEAAKAAKAASVQFVSGIEISVKGNEELHLLGYLIDCDNPGLVSMCDDFARLRKIRAERIFDFLKAQGIVLTPSQVEAHSSGVILGRPHFAKAMVEAGYVKDVREAFDRYLGTEEFQRIERPKPEPEEGIRIIREAGGIAVLAHPALLKLSDDDLEALIEHLLPMGLDGIECYYSLHTREQTEFYMSLAEKHGLIITGGSDFHGEKIKPKVILGETGAVPYERFDDLEIKEKLELARRRRGYFVER